MTMRADFYSHAATYYDLAARLERQQRVVSPLDEADLRQAIEGPARLVGLHFEKGLVDTILDDAGPICRKSLRRCWIKFNDGRWRAGRSWGALLSIRRTNGTWLLVVMCRQVLTTMVSPRWKTAWAWCGDSLTNGIR